MSDLPDRPHEGELILYQTAEGTVRIEVLYESETFWLNQKRIAELFGVDVRTVSEHLVGIYESGELTKAATIRKFRRVQIEGNREVRREIEFYNLDAIISVGYRFLMSRSRLAPFVSTLIMAASIAAGLALAQAPAGPAARPFGPQPAAAPVAWSAIVGAATLESEIRSQADRLDRALNSTNPQKAVRRELTYLAALYGVVDRYDQAVAWKSEAHAARDTYARSADLAKSWNEFRPLDIAKRLRALTEHLRGKNEQFPEALPRDAPWSSFVARPPLMHRLEQAQIERLTNWTRDAETVKKNAAAVAREAEIVAMLARILQDPGYEFGPERRYQRFARELEEQALECVKAIERGESSGAIRAYIGMQRACDACHGEYR